MKALKILGIIAAILILGVVILASMYISRRNEMVAMKEAVEQAWSQVDVVIQRRADLA